MTISIPVVSFQSGYAQIQITSEPVLDNIIKQKRQDEQAKKEALNPTPPAGNSSQDAVPDPTLKDILEQKEIDNRFKDMLSSAKLEVTTNPKGNDTDLAELADYTFLVYMIGSDLELKQYSATKDIREMLSVGSTKDVNIIIETGGSKNSVKDGERFIDFTTVQRHKILKHHHLTLEDLGRENMATSNTLSDFLIWGISEFPAKSYAIILWDHGSGINGFGADSNFNGDILTHVELAKAFEDSKDSTRTNFEIIGFDACLMASIEVADTVRSFGNYMVASQELIPPDGWDYSTFLSSLVRSPSQDGLTLGKNIADSFQEYYRFNAEELGYDVYRVTTISIMDLDRVSGLVDSMRELARYLNYSISDMNSAKRFARIIDSTDSYGKSATGQSNLVDIYDLASNIMEKLPESSGIINRVHKMLTNTVVNKTNGESKPDANGLSVYLPKTYGVSLDQSVVNSLDAWQQIVNKQYYFLHLDKKRPTLSSQTIEKTISGWVDPADVSNVTLNVARMHSGFYSTYIEELDPLDIIDKNGYFRYSSDGSILSLCSRDYCTPATMKFDSNGYNKYALFPVTVLSNGYFYFGFLLFYEINEIEERIRFLGAVPQVSTEATVSKERHEIPHGSFIYPEIPSVSLEYAYKVITEQSELDKYIESYNKTIQNVTQGINTARINITDEGLLKVPQNGSFAFADEYYSKLMGNRSGIPVIDYVHPKYTIYNNESSEVWLTFCDYSNNCHDSSHILNAISHYDGLSPKKNSFDSTENLTGFDSYESIDSGVQIKFPKKWKDQIPQGRDGIIDFGKKVESGEIVITYVSASEEFDILKLTSNRLDKLLPKQMATLRTNDLAKTIVNLNLLISTPTILSGELAHKIEYSYTIGENKWIATEIISNGANAFLISYRCLAEFCTQSMPTFLKIVRSLKFIDGHSTAKNPVFLSYENPMAGVTMKYKSDWKKNEHIGILPLSPVASFISPLENDQDRFLESISLYIQNLPSNFTKHTTKNNTNKYVDSLMRSSLSDFKIGDLPLVYLSLGKTWNLLSYPAEFGDMSVGIVELWNVSLKDDKMYRIQFLYEGGKHKDYESILLKMLGSIKNDPSDYYGWSFLTYDDPSSGISIQHPANWKLQPYNLNALQDKVVEFWPLVNNTDPRGFSDARVTIGINESNSNIPIDKVADNLIKSYPNYIPAFELLEMDTNTTFSGLPAFKLIFTLSSNNLPLRGMIVGAVLDGTLYRLVYVSPAEKFDAYLSKVMHMIESFKIGLES